MDLFKTIRESMDLKEIDANEYSPLTLAYIGDCSYEIIIRTIAVDEHNQQTHKLHKKVSEYVKASTQAKIIFLIMDELTKEEINIYKRGRNAKAFTRAKNASMSDYRQATGFEALMGWLYLSDKSQRMMELIKLGIDRYKKEQAE